MNTPVKDGSPPPSAGGQATGASSRTIDGALADLPAPSLHALRCVAAEPSAIAPVLMVWIEHAAAWEIDRRAGRRYPLHQPGDAIDAAQVSPTLLALAALSRRFGAEHPQVDNFFRAISASLDTDRVVH
jgi:hypothetical protein